jgi:hypothetical protein
MLASHTNKPFDALCETKESDVFLLITEPTEKVLTLGRCENTEDRPAMPRDLRLSGR